MLIDFVQMNAVTISNLNGGNGDVSAKMSIQKNGKIMLAKLPAGASIGMHIHETSDDINYVIRGVGKAICDGKEELLTEGVCHYCQYRRRGFDFVYICAGIDRKRRSFTWRHHLNT